VGRLQSERDELEGRADDAEGGLAAAQAEMETVQKRLEAELAALQQTTRREREDTAAAHDAEVGCCSETRDKKRLHILQCQQYQHGTRGRLSLIEQLASEPCEASSPLPVALSSSSLVWRKSWMLSARWGVLVVPMEQRAIGSKSSRISGWLCGELRCLTGAV
jgi:hypothetical protein